MDEQINNQRCVENGTMENVDGVLTPKGWSNVYQNMLKLYGPEVLPIIDVVITGCLGGSKLTELKEEMSTYLQTSVCNCHDCQVARLMKSQEN